MKDCPRCFKAVDGLVCPTCHYRDPAAGPETTAGPADKWRCANMERGHRCFDGARFFPGTRGDGPGYCWTHANFVHGGHPETGKPVPPPEGTFEALRALTRRVAPVPRPLDVETVMERAAIQAEPPPNVVQLRPRADHDQERPAT